jgi:hypothetical protein
MTKFSSAVRILFALSAVALVATGCVTAKPTELEAGTATAAAAAPSSDSTSTSDSTTTAAVDDSSRATLAAAIDAHLLDSDGQPSLINRSNVQAGDHLWGISSQQQVYGDPYQWPLLFKRNRGEIEDADLIYPGQVLHIDRDANEHQIQQAIDHAKTRGAWSLGVTETSDLEYLAKAQSSQVIHQEVEQVVARAGDDLGRARLAGAVWRMVDLSTGGSAVSLDELLRVAGQKLQTGDLDEAMRIALRVSEASILGIEQAQSQSRARPSYN